MCWAESSLPSTMDDLGMSSTFFPDSRGISEHKKSDEFRTKTKTNVKTDVKNKTNMCVRTNSWNAIPAQSVVVAHGFYLKEKYYKY